MKAAGATVGAAAFGGPITAFASQGPPRIAIVGGGIAGLNAALTLHDAGYASTVYEASNRVGGRMHSDTTSWNGQVSEHCGELIDTGHKTIQGLAKRFGFGLTDLLAAQPNQSTDTFYFFGSYYNDDQANIDFKPVYNQVHGDASAAGFPTLYNQSTPRGVGETERTWIEITTFGELRKNRLVDWATLGMIAEVLLDMNSPPPA